MKYLFELAIIMATLSLYGLGKYEMIGILSIILLVTHISTEFIYYYLKEKWKIENLKQKTGKKISGKEKNKNSTTN